MADDPIVLDDKARDAIHAATDAAHAIEVARIAQFQELTESLKEKTTATITLAENKAKSLVESAAKDAMNLLAIAKREASDMVPSPVAASDMRVMANDIGYIKQSVAKIEESLGRDYVSMDTFTPVRNIVYGLVGTLGLATMAALLKLIFKV